MHSKPSEEKNQTFSYKWIHGEETLAETKGFKVSIHSNKMCSTDDGHPLARVSIVLHSYFKGPNGKLKLRDNLDNNSYIAVFLTRQSGRSINEMLCKITLERILEQKSDSPRKTDEIWRTSLVDSISKYKFLVWSKVQWTYKMLTSSRRNWAKETFNFYFLIFFFFLIFEYWEEGRGHSVQ